MSKLTCQVVEQILSASDLIEIANKVNDNVYICVCNDHVPDIRMEECFIIRATSKKDLYDKMLQNKEILEVMYSVEHDEDRDDENDMEKWMNQDYSILLNILMDCIVNGNVGYVKFSELS